eukprot:6507138-Pyramimonas_sp.AAC.1
MPHSRSDESLGRRRTTGRRSPLEPRRRNPSPPPESRPRPPTESHTSERAELRSRFREAASRAVGAAGAPEGWRCCDAPLPPAPVTVWLWLAPAPAPCARASHSHFPLGLTLPPRSSDL